MRASNKSVRTERTSKGSEMPWQAIDRQRPSFRWSDIWKAPLHDLPIRDQVLYQYLPLSPDMHALEIGPGSGFTAFRLARRVRHLTLVDVAPATILYLRRALKEIQNITFVCADVCAPRLAESVGTQFDAVFGLEVFELLADPGACLTNFATVLRQGGHLLLQFPNYPPPRSPGIIYFRRREELDRLLRAAGFEQWAVYALKLRPYAHIIYHEFHERPLRLYRWLRGRNGQQRPLAYDQSWAFQHRQRLEPYKYLLHGAWMMLFAALRLGGECFERQLLGDEILNRNLLLLARR